MVKVKWWGDPVDEGAREQLIRCAEHPDVRWAGMMADHHLGYSVPIGGVIAYANSVSPSGVGYDIGCGNKAVKLDIPASEVRANIKTIMDDIYSNISFGMGRKNTTQVCWYALDDLGQWKHPAVRDLRPLAQSQLGTVGGGNHYVDIFVDESDAVWVGVHFGSRGLGHKIASWFLREGGAANGIHAEPLVLDADSGLGADYIPLMTLAGDYAYAGRNWVCNRVTEMLGANQIEEVHNHHNYAWYERHGDQFLWVVRKGATPAFPGQRGFIGASMGETAYIVSGTEGPAARAALYSAPHGAGRAMSRTAARGKMNRKTGEIISTGAISQTAMDEWIREAGVELRGADLDEAPQAYKRLDEVLMFHDGSLAIEHRLTPIGVAMAGRDVVDPYKD